MILMFFHPLQPVEGHTAAMLELRDHRGGSYIVFFRAYTFRFLGCEHLPAGIASLLRCPLLLMYGTALRFAQ